MKRGDILWFTLLMGMLALLIRFGSLMAGHPYLLGFVKFALLATMGELLALRLKIGRWQRPQALSIRILIWGFVGILIVFFFQLFPAGVLFLQEKGMLPGKNIPLLRAFFISLSMNFSFGIAFMASHRVSDSWLDLPRNERSLEEAVRRVDWSYFVRFVVLGTLPFFWIPAHTLTFLLPEGLRVLVAALLSICLGLILSWKKK